MNVKELVEYIFNGVSDGYQVSKCRGIVRTTWLVYLRNDFIYFFDIIDEVEFVDRFKHSRNDFIKAYAGSYFEIEEEIK